MTAAALLLLTCAVMLLPMLPALIEWRWPSDVVPLHIDGQDALDPPFLARSFHQQLLEALSQGKSRLGRSLIARVSGLGDLRLSERELARGRSRRVWIAPRDLTLPAGITYLGEVSADGHLRTSPGAVCRGLRAGGRLVLDERSTVLRWAHATQVEVHSACDLAGRISADERIHLLGPANFMLLHAPVLSFGNDPGQADDDMPWVPTPHLRTAWGSSAALTPQQRGQRPGGLPAPVAWNEVARRGTSAVALQVAGGSHWLGDLVCHDDCTLGLRCHASGSLKVHGDLVLGAGSRVAGSLVASGRIELGMGCVVLGSVMSETEVVLGSGCVIGAPGILATVSAPIVRVAPDVLVHGTLWASESGRTQSMDAWLDEPERLDAAFVERRAGPTTDGAEPWPDAWTEPWADPWADPRQPPGARW